MKNKLEIQKKYIKVKIEIILLLLGLCIFLWAWPYYYKYVRWQLGEASLIDARYDKESNKIRYEGSICSGIVQWSTGGNTPK